MTNERTASVAWSERTKGKGDWGPRSFAEFFNLSPSSSYFLPFRNSNALSLPLPLPPSPSHKAPIHIWHFKAQLLGFGLFPLCSLRASVSSLHTAVQTAEQDAASEILRNRLTYQISKRRSQTSDHRDLFELRRGICFCRFVV